MQDVVSEHRRAIEKAIAKQLIDQLTAVSEHFTFPVHTMDNIDLVPLELITSNRDCNASGTTCRNSSGVKPYLGLDQDQQ